MGELRTRQLLRRRGRRGFPRWAVLARRLAVLGVVIGTLLLPQAASAQDNTPPVVTYTVSGIVGTNGWYRGSAGGNYVVVHWTVSDPESQITYSSPGCLPADRVAGPTTGTTRTCSATSDGGTTSVTTKLLKIDATPPAVGGGASRPPDANGWYNHPLTISFSGSDATSGIASCSSAGYSGPDNAAASVSGNCRDNAGNVRTAAFSFKYDATAPRLGKVRVKHLNRAVLLRWTASSDTQHSEVVRSGGPKGAKTATVYSGAGTAYRDKRLRVGAKYRYTVTAFDQAANTAHQTVAVLATGPLLSPVPGARVTAPPLLRWIPVKGASYYNVQLIRGGKIFSAWPTRPHLKLPWSWVYRGHRHRLHRGVYRWYVWPGFGTRGASRYGRLIGGSSFLFSQ